jgi:hypothetical protein
LRGDAGTVAEISVLKTDGEVWAGQLTRIGLQIEPLSTENVTSVLGQSEGLTKAEIEFYAGSKAQAGYTLLGVLQQGRLVQDDSPIAANLASAVYTGNPEVVKPKLQASLTDAQVVLQALTRQAVSFYLGRSGMTDVQLLDAQGKQITSWSVNASQGDLKLSWEGKTQPRGAYNLRVKQGINQSSFAATLD